LLPFYNGDDYIREMSEHDLLKAFREERSEQAFAELVRRYAGLVYSVAKRRLNDAALAEDITQMVFIRFAKTPPQLQSDDGLAAWLHRTTVNVTVDTWRSETRRRKREQQTFVMESTPTEDAIWEELSPNLDEALNQLKDEDRRALMLRFFDQKTMRDIGTALGVSEDAAKMRVSRALDRMRAQLGVRNAACTAAVLGTILDERSVQAAPTRLISRLAAMKLPAAAGAAGIVGSLGALLRVSKFNLAASAVVLAVIVGGIVRLAQSSIAPVPETAALNFQTNLTGNTIGIASRTRIVSAGFTTPGSPPPKPAKLLFHVLDAATGKGLPNAKIEAAYFGAGGIGHGDDFLADDNGVVAVSEPDPQDSHGMNVFVAAEGHVPKAVEFDGDASPAEYTMKLEPAMTAGGMIVDEQGLPVPGVKILIQGPGVQQGQAESIDFQTCPVTNQDDGSWSCSYVPLDYTNEIRFILKKTGYATTFPAVPVARVNLTNLVLVINRGFAVTGQIADTQNRPIANARIKTLGGNRDDRQSVRTDEHGVFTLEGVDDWRDGMPQPLQTNENGAVVIREASVNSPFHLDLAVQAEGFAPQTNSVELSVPTNVVNFTLAKGNIFRGRVVDEMGIPIPNAVVQTDFDFKHQIEKPYEWTTHTDENGWFEWDSAPAGAICYWFEADRYTVIRGMPLLADGSDHEITLTRNAPK
jgi:RNA polymerase sigma factor (sigma-70 family)